MKYIKLIVKQIILNFKSITQDKINIILLFLIPLLTTTIPVFFIPLAYSMGVVITSTIMIVTFIIYQRIALSFKKSTLYSNSKLASGNRWLMNLSTIITLLIVGYFIFIFLIIVLQILANLNFLLWGYRNYSDWGHWNLFNLPFVYVIYQISLLIIVTFSLSYFIEKFSDNTNFYYITAIVLFILIFIFGGSFNNYFHEPIKNNEGVYSPVFDESQSIFPGSMFVPSLLLPFFAPSQMITITGEMVKMNPNNQIVWGPYQNFTPWFWTTKSMFSDIYNISNSWRWNILWITPYIHIVFWFLLGRLIENKNR